MNNGHTTSPITQAMDQARADYRAARQTRFTRDLVGVRTAGSSADFHYSSEMQYFRLMEMARALDRDDIIAGPIVKRLIDNVIQDGFTVDPKTQNPELNKLLKAKWAAYSSDPNRVDVQGEMDFKLIERLALRHMIVDGDIVILPLHSGSMQAIEAHRLRSPGDLDGETRSRTIHGVELDGLRRRVRYWITRDDISPYHPVATREMTSVNARDADGFHQLWHIYHPRRVTQTRGVTAFASSADTATMHDDVQFAKLVQQQGVSSWMLIRTRQLGFEFTDEPDVRYEPDPCHPGQMSPIRDVRPGLMYTGHPGETVSGFSPNVPNPTFFDHARQLQQLISINLDVPLILLLYDGSETNFSGWRGSMDQAKVAFRCLQHWYASAFHRKAYTWKLRQWVDPSSPEFDEEVLVAAISDPNWMDHDWIFPSWPYIEPLKDVTADVTEMNGCINSPRRIQRKHSRDWDTVSSEIVEDNAKMIREAKAMAIAINSEFADGDPVRWKELVSLPTNVGVNTSLTESINSEDGSNAEEKRIAA